MRHYSIISLFACLFLMACPSRKTPLEETSSPTTQPVATSQNSECSTYAMVKDFTGMDGCRILFELNNGDKLLPNEMPLMDFTLENNQAVKIDYDIVKDGVSACMMESEIIKVNCINLIGLTGGVKPAKTPCVKADNYEGSKWLKHIAGDMSPYLVTRYSYNTDGWAYLLENGRERKLYDCQGSLICTAYGKALNECTTQIANLGKGTIIHATKPSRK